MKTLPSRFTFFSGRFSPLAGHAAAMRCRGRAAAPPSVAPEGWPGGHFYSPIVAAADAERHAPRAAAAALRPEIPGIDIDPQRQLTAYARLVAAAPAHRWRARPTAGCRYGFENPNFGPGEALLLLGVLAESQPRRIVEVGSGWSTAALLDANDAAVEGRAEVVAVEPYPELVRSLVRAADPLTVVERPVQDVGLELFSGLQAGDMLLIDSTHVAKFGSDVPFLVGEVLPRLRPGVRVHVHDIFHPFDYPIEWVRQGRNWNESYVWRAFLAFNAAFRIDCFASYVWAVAPDEAARILPEAAVSPGSSLWLVRS